MICWRVLQFEKLAAVGGLVGVSYKAFRWKVKDLVLHEQDSLSMKQEAGEAEEKSLKSFGQVHVLRSTSNL